LVISQPSSTEASSSPEMADFEDGNGGGQFEG
jgi:hypothetical protein